MAEQFTTSSSTGACSSSDSSRHDSARTCADADTAAVAAVAGSSCDSVSSGTTSLRLQRRGRVTTMSRHEALRWRKHWLNAHRAAANRRRSSAQIPYPSLSSCTTSQSNSRLLLATSEEIPTTASHDQFEDEDENRSNAEDEDYEEDRATGFTRSFGDRVTLGTNFSADAEEGGFSPPLPADSQDSQESQTPDPAEETLKEETAAAADTEEAAVPTSGSTEEEKPPKPSLGSGTTSDDGQVFANLESGTAPSDLQPPPEEGKEQGTSGTGTAAGATGGKSDLANVIEKAILDFCSSRTVETMRRMFAGATSEMEALQGEGGRQGGDKSVQAPHPVTGELVKEGIVIGAMDVFAPRVYREFRLQMRDSLVEGFLKDVGVFRSICYRTKCQLEVTRRLLNKKMCTGGRWVKYLIVRIVGPSLRAISCCDQLLQKAVPAFKCRLEYPKPAYCRLFFREDIPDNTLLYSSFQRTGGTSNRYGALRLETPYRLTTERTVGNCPWKSGALKVGKLSFSGSGGHMCMQQVYPGYGYTYSSPVEPESKGVDAVHRIEQMHQQFVTGRQALLQERRVMTIPVCR